jgi:hypothetical protein
MVCDDGSRRFIKVILIGFQWTCLSKVLALLQPGDFYMQKQLAITSSG